MSLVRTLCGFTDRCVALCSPSWSRSTVCSGVREIGESLILSPDAESPSYKPATPFFHGTCSNINHSPLIDWQGLAEAIAQFKDLPSGTSDYVFGQCDQAALAHAGGSQAALKNNYLTYICTYPFQNVDDLGEPYSEGFTGLAQVGQQGQTCLFFFFKKKEESEERKFPSKECRVSISTPLFFSSSSSSSFSVSGAIIKGCFRNLSPKRAVFHHEIGHNLGFKHSWTWLPDPELGPSDPYAPNQNDGQVSVTELSDESLPFSARLPFDIMGSAILENIPYQVEFRK